MNPLTKTGRRRAIANAPVRSRTAAVALAVVVGGLLGASSAAAEDGVVMLDGSRLRGTVTAETEDSVSIRTRRGMSITIPLERVRTITTAGGTREVNPAQEPKPSVHARREEAAGRTAAPEKTRRREEPPPPFDQGKATASPGYARATAHDPCFDQKGLWPEDVEKTAYYKQKWEPARLLVWSKKGEHRESLKGAGSWTEYAVSRDGSLAKTGKPASKGPDESTDILFPDADSRCSIGIDHGSNILKARHVTVGRNVHLMLRGSGFTGNVWVKEGGFIWERNPKYQGDGHSFARNDNTQERAQEFRLPRNRARIVFKMPHVAKVRGASIEFLGPWGNGDGLFVLSGTMIIGPDSSFHAGCRHVNTVCPKGAMVLMSGATYQTIHNNPTNPDLRVHGRLLAGTPERPLTRDACFLMDYKWRGRHEHRGKPLGPPGDTGLFVYEEGSLAVHSADPERARLVFGLRVPASDKEKPLKSEVSITLVGKADLNGVEFNDFERGGIMLGDLSVRKGWKNVFYGKGNMGSEDELYAQFTGRRPRADGYAQTQLRRLEEAEE
jgi:hypothetical protein